jgi:hypothetical protein
MDAPTADQAQPEQSDSTRKPDELFRYSGWIHVGVGAQECELREAGTCTDRGHFHAWCRVPNQLQHQDIRERALAAKARRIRQLKDPQTDAYLILEGDLDDLRADREALNEELVGKDWWKRHLDAIGHVEQEEEYKHIEKDRERFRQLQATPVDERPKDEFDELERHFAAYSDKIETRLRELETPVREATEGLTDDEAIQQVREDRIAAQGSATFMDTYAKYQWLAGTYTSADPITRKRAFSSVEAMQEEAPEIIDALRSTFSDLEQALHRGPRGN